MAHNSQHKLLLNLFCSLILISPVTFAEQYEVGVINIKPNKIFTQSSANLTLQNDGALYSISTLFNSNETSISKQLPNGKFMTLGNIPHPDIIKLDDSSLKNPISIGANKSGVVIVAYPFYNEQSKYQFVFYKFKNNQWSRLPDLIDRNTDINIGKIFIDDNENVYFWTKDSFKLYELNNGTWQLMNNLANDPKTEVFQEKIFNINNDSVYTTKIDIKSNSFNVYKYNQNTIDYSDNISLNNNEYVPSCTAKFGENKVITAFVNSHDNLVKKSIKFQLINLNNNFEKSIENNVPSNSLLGSIFSLGKATVNLATNGNKPQGDESSPAQSITIKEIDLSKYLKNYSVDTSNKIQCASVGNDDYFVLKTYVSNMAVEYVYFKIINKNAK